MKNRILLIVLLLISTFSIGLAFKAQTQPRYEYKIEYSPKEKKVNELATDGWELVAVGSQGDTITMSVFVFRRAKVQ